MGISIFWYISGEIPDADPYLFKIGPPFGAMALFTPGDGIRDIFKIAIRTIGGWKTTPTQIFSLKKGKQEFILSGKPSAFDKESEKTLNPALSEPEQAIF